MTRFTLHQRVTVLASTGMLQFLAGRTGTVERLRRSDDGAFVRMDGALPDSLRRFPVGDGRENDILLYPEECECVINS